MSSPAEGSKQVIPQPGPNLRKGDTVAVWYATNPDVAKVSEGPRLRDVYRSLKQRALGSPSGEASVKVRRRGLHTPGQAGWQSHREVERA